MKTETKKIWEQIIATCYNEDFKDNHTIAKAIKYFDSRFEIAITKKSKNENR
jgi:hypothetical protein